MQNTMLWVPVLKAFPFEDEQSVEGEVVLAGASVLARRIRSSWNYAVDSAGCKDWWRYELSYPG